MFERTRPESANNLLRWVAYSFKIPSRYSGCFIWRRRLEYPWRQLASHKVTGLVSGIFHIHPRRFDVTAAAGASRGFGIGGSGLTAVARASHSNCNFSILAYEDRLITITEDSYAGGKVNPWVSGSWFAIR